MNELVVSRTTAAPDAAVSKALIFSTSACNRRTLQRWVDRQLQTRGNQVHTVGTAEQFKQRFLEENGNTAPACCAQPFDLLVLDASGLDTNGILAIAEAARVCCEQSAAIMLVILASEHGPEGISPGQKYTNLPGVQLFYYSFGTQRTPI